MDIFIEYGDLGEKSIIVTNIIGFDANGASVFQRMHAGRIKQPICSIHAIGVHYMSPFIN
jgi:hypothetical protein